MSPTADPQLGRVLGSQYRIEALLGQGGMGAVYRGLQLSVQRPVAIKLINTSAANQAEILTRFRREAEATARLSHPNSVRLFDFGVTESHEMFMVMELLEGCDLAARLTDGPLPLQEALFIVREVLQALSEAHALGIVHRDLKPGNVFLARVHGGESVVKVMDFGIAGIEQARDGQKLTMTGAVMGTPAYMSPEQAQGKPVDARCDLYSIGVMLFEMLTGQPPFEANTLVSLLLAHVTQPPKRLDEAGVQLPNQAALQALLDRLLAKNPIDRPPSAAHALAVIEQLLARDDGGAQTARLSDSSSNRTARLQAPRGETALASGPPAKPQTPIGWDRTAAPPVAPQPSAPRAGERRWLLAAAAAGALALLVFVALRAATTQTELVKVTQPSAAGANAALAADAQHRVLLATTPSGASVARGGEVLGHTPVELGVTSPAEFELSLPGYSPQRVRLSKDSPAHVSVALIASLEKAPHAGHATKNAGRKLEDDAPAEERVSAALTETSSAPPPRDTERVRREALLKRAPPYASLAAAQRAYSSGKIDANALQDAVWVLKTRRNERIEIEKENLKRGTITAQEYEWRLGRIDAELRGE